MAIKTIFDLFFFPLFGLFFFPFGFIFFLFIIFFALRWIFWPWRGRYHHGYGYWYGWNDAREILRQRYARGEITKEQFTQMMQDLQEHPQ